MLYRLVANRFSVHDLSKLHKYRYYYDVMKQKYHGSKSTLAYTDMDSFLMEIAMEDVYADMIRDLHWYDFSKYRNNMCCFMRLGLTDEQIEQLCKEN